jgi:hypothetical protein
LLEESDHLREDVIALAGSVRRAARGWQTVLRQQLERQPYATLAVAAGVGYVLGGGVPTLLIRSLVGFGGRVALEQAIARLAASSSPDSHSC